MSELSIKEKLFQEPYRFEFFQAVRLMQQMFPEKKPVGRDALPHEEIVRFRSHITLEFPPSQIHELRESFNEATQKEHIEMLVSFMGLVGASGVMPIHYTELIHDRLRHRDTALWEFLDLFNHRAVSMFYKAWEKYRFPAGYERGDDNFTSYLFDWAGLGTPGLRGQMGLEDESLLPYAGLIAQKPHSGSSIESMLSDYFGADAEVQQYHGQWLPLSRSDLTKLGQAKSVLGRSAIIGSRVWDQQSKFRVRFNSLTFVQFQAFLPNGSANKSLKSIVKFMVGLEFDFDVQLELQAAQVPSLILTTRAMRKPMLGWTTWLKSEPFTENDDQLVLGLE